MTKALLILILPCLEYVVIRFWLREVLAIRVGWFSMTDNEYILPGIISTLMFLMCLQGGAPLQLRWRNKSLLIHFGCLTAFCLFNLLLWTLGIHSLSRSLYLLWWFFAIVSFATSLLPLTGTSFFIRNRFRWIVIPAAIMGLSFPLAMQLPEAVWQTLVPLIAKPTCAMLETAFYPEFRCAMRAPNVTLLHPDFKVILGQGCSGMEAIFFASISFLVWTWRHPQSLPSRLWSVFFALNLFIFFCLNVLRIASIFSLGVWLKDSQLSVEFFHAHVGWLAYALVQWLYLHYLRKLTHMFASRAAQVKIVTYSLVVTAIVGLSAFYSSTNFAACVAPCDTCCFSQEDCDVTCGCAGGGTDCGDCSSLNISNCEQWGNDVLCTWNGSSCEELNSIDEIPHSFKAWLATLALTIPFMGTGWRRRNRFCLEQTKARR